MNIGEAIEEMRKGRRVSRRGWNGKDMFLMYVSDKGWTLLFGNTTDIKLAPFIVMKTADNRYVPWLASQTDILADDWFLVLKN